MAELIKQTYNDVEITYHENTDKWVFELGGKERFAGSLREAKQAIDSAPKPKRAATRFPAILIGWAGDKIDEVTVGAFSKDHRGKPQFWISNDGSRSKEDAMMLVKLNDTNAPLIAEAREINQKIVELKQRRAEKIATMERVDIPAEDGDSASN